jgi:hypothetical protein
LHGKVSFTSKAPQRTDDSPLYPGTTTGTMTGTMADAMMRAAKGCDGFA